jgi:hypothetical protein
MDLSRGLGDVYKRQRMRMSSRRWKVVRGN